MNFTYVGEWIERGERPNVSEERMVADLAYIYSHPNEFEDWYNLFNDGCDTYVVLTGNSRLDLLEAMTPYLKEDNNAEVHSL